MTYAEKYAELERHRFALLAKLEAEQDVTISAPPTEPPSEIRAAARLLARAVRHDQQRRDYYEHCQTQKRMRRMRTAA